MFKSVSAQMRGIGNLAALLQQILEPASTYTYCRSQSGNSWRLPLDSLHCILKSLGGRLQGCLIISDPFLGALQSALSLHQLSHLGRLLISFPRLCKLHNIPSNFSCAPDPDQQTHASLLAAHVCRSKSSAAVSRLKCDHQNKSEPIL